MPQQGVFNKCFFFTFLKMFTEKVFFCLCILISIGVFGVDGDEVKSVMEGDSVTLPTNISEIQRDHLIEWIFESNTLIAVITHSSRKVYEERSRDRLKLDHQTGSLTITNITITHTGLYKLKISSTSRGTSEKRFNVTVYALLPVHVISRDSSQCLSSSSSSSNCSLLCSVLDVRDVRDVSLSWYKGNSLLSSISVSDLNTKLSLEVDYHDNKTYSCVVNNPIRNRTLHLNINELCQCSDFSPLILIAPAVLVFTALGLLGLIAGVIHYHKKIQKGLRKPAYIKWMQAYEGSRQSKTYCTHQKC
nr:SLAM family member 5-like [Misgurnus anguillicaudatus]